MKRIQLFEIEDYQWLPSILRTGATNLIVVFHKILGTSEILSSLVQNIRKSHKFNQIVDLGSGSGGAMPKALELINENSSNPLKMILTDLHPNAKLVNEINSRKYLNISHLSTSVDATNFSDMPEGLKTMIASFHHMPPNVARKILHSAQENKQPILIYEIAKNNIPLLAWWLFLPISLVILFVMALVLTPFVRPLTGSQLLFTYIIPIIPIIYAWDGQASLVRTYTFEDIEELIGEKVDGYSWSVGDAVKKNGKKGGYFVIGKPS